jgi:uncharacterized protein (TIGR02246 family)
MKAIFLLFIISVFAFIKSSNNNIKDEEKIHQIIKEQESAWNKGDAKEYVQSFMEEGTFTIITGTVFHKQSDLEKRVAFIFSTFFKNSKLTQKVNQIRFIYDNAAIVEIETEMIDFKGLPPGVGDSKDKILRTSMLQVMVKINNEWKVAAFHNVDVKIPYVIINPIKYKN